MNNPSEKLKELIEIKFEHSESCGCGYWSPMYRKYYMDKSEEIRIAHNRLANVYRMEYWEKFHGNTLLEKRELMAQHFGMPLELIEESFFLNGKAHIQGDANKIYSSKYFKEVFEPIYFLKIKSFLREFNPLFKAFNDIFLLAIILKVHNDKNRDYKYTLERYNNDIDLYGIFLHHAYHIVRHNRNNRIYDIPNDEYFHIVNILAAPHFAKKSVA